MTETEDTVRFYFTFRSPYAWLAYARIEPALTKLPVQLDYIPVFPPPNFANDPTAVPNKAKYIREDVQRIAAAYGFPYKFPEQLDCEWIRPHAVFVYAQDQGCAQRFGRGMFDARFAYGRDLGDDAVVADVARAAGLDPEAAIKAADDKGYQTRVFTGMIQAAQEDSIFGVPYFVYRGEKFWGNDRIDWLTRAIRRAHGIPVVDLSKDFLVALDR